MARLEEGLGGCKIARGGRSKRGNSPGNVIALDRAGFSSLPDQRKGWKIVYVKGHGRSEEQGLIGSLAMNKGGHSPGTCFRLEDGRRLSQHKRMDRAMLTVALEKSPNQMEGYSLETAI